MRTDSNTVLSLSSGVPPKVSKLPKALQENGEAFDRDFNNAKEILTPKPAVTAEKAEKAVGNSDSTESKPLAVDADIVESKSLEYDEGEGEPASNVLSTKSSEAAVAVAELNEEGGNVLQFKGDILPTSPSAIEVEGDTFLPVSDLQSDAFQTSALVGVDGRGQLAEIKPDIGLDEALVDLNVDGPLDNLDKSLVNGNNINGSLQFSADRVNDIASKSNVLEGEGSTVLTSSAALSSIAVDPLNVDSSVLSSEVSSIDAQDEDGLSWVLSQMNGSTSKLVPTDLESAISPDGVKIDKEFGVTLLASGIMKNNRAEPVLSPFSMESVASPAIEDADLKENILDSLDVEDVIFVDEPIELRKKEQEALMGRMSAQIDGKVGDDNVAGGLNSSLLNSGVVRPAFNLAAANAAPQVNLAMNLPPSHPGWASEISQKVSWVARDGGHTAHIRLDPPELGSLTVKISVDNDSNTQVSFMAATPQARDLLEGQMSRLRDMLAQQGMDLSRADVDVSQQDTSSMQRDMEQNNRSNRTDIASQDELDEDLISSNVSYVSATGVDYYA